MEPIRICRTPFQLRPRDGQPPVRCDLRVPDGPLRRSAVVLVHGFKGFRNYAFIPVLARALAARGHAAVTVDLSRNGVGDDGVAFSALERFAEQTHTRNVQEIRMVLDAVTGGDLLPAVRRVGLWGHSRGGAEAILAAAQDPRVDALVTWAAVGSLHRWSEEQIARWRRGETVEVANARTGQLMPVSPAYWHDLEANTARLDVRAAAERVGAPWLIVHGEADETAAVADAHSLFEMAGENAEMLRVEGAGHTFGAVHPYAGATDALRTAAEATLEWFAATLR